MTQRRPRTHKFRWHQIYFLLAAFDVLTIGGTLLLSHVLMGLFAESVEVNSALARRLEFYAGLHRSASDANAPGNEVFESGDVEGARAQLEQTAAKFRSLLESERATLEEAQYLQRDVLMAQIPIVERQFAAMIFESNKILAALADGDSATAGNAMSAMDHNFYRVNEEIAKLEGMVRQTQFDTLNGQASKALGLRQYEFVIGVIMLFIVLAVTLYGHKISRHMALAEERDQSRVAELMKSQAELRTALQVAGNASQAKGQFLANMSHEIRTPMTAILGYAECLQDPEINDDDRRAFVDTIVRNGDHLLALISDVLDVSKIESGNVAVERIPTRPLQLLTEVRDLFQERVKRKGLTLSFVTEPIPIQICSDPTRLKQIVVNLVGNAIKFTHDGEVEVCAAIVGEEPECRLRLEVIDSGIGMTEEQLQRLFRPFTQADESMTRRYGGTGLGLAISHHLAGELGGGLTVASEVGVGSVFTVEVTTGPLQGVERRRWSEPRRPPAERPSQELPLKLDCRVLVAEDAVDNQRLIRRVLERVGVEVKVVENGAVAVAETMRAWESGTPYHVVLMDLQMPVTDGHTATRELRSLGYDGPIIALTAHAMVTERARCIETGFDDFATKPLQPRTLCSLIDRYRVQEWQVGDVSTPR